MLKFLVVLAAAFAILSTTGCCWPLHEGRRGYYRDGYSDGQRPPPPGRYDDDRRDGRR
jgi:hypothetical protein